MWYQTDNYAITIAGVLPAALAGACSVPLSLCASSFRTTLISPHVSPRRYANSWRFCEDHHDEWKSTAEAMDCRALLVGEATGGPGGWAYMDGLSIGGMGCSPFSKGAHCPGQTDGEYRTAFVLWSVAQSPIVVTTDVRNMTAIMTQALLNTELLAIHQSTATAPGGKIATWECSEPLACQVWGRPVSADGSEWLVALANTGSKAHKISVEWKALGWQLAAEASVRDLWNHIDLPTAAGSLEREVPSHDVFVARLSLAKPRRS